MKPPVLRMPNFDQNFVLECDASGVGVGVVIMQDNHPIAFTSQRLQGRALLLSAYERKMLVITRAVKK